MAAVVKLRTDYSTSDLRRLADASKHADQSRRLLSPAAVLDGMDREQAARIGGMDRQTRNWFALGPHPQRAREEREGDGVSIFGANERRVPVGIPRGDFFSRMIGEIKGAKCAIVRGSSRRSPSR